MSSIIVADEWVYHYLRNEQDKSQAVSAFLFLKAVRNRGDRLVVVKGSPFTRKAYLLAKENREPLKLYSKELLGIISSDSCILLEQEELVAFPDELNAAVKDDDRYLVRAQMSVANSFILTSDGDLITALTSHTEIRLEHTDTFLQGYINNEPPAEVAPARRRGVKRKQR